ncbi:MAG TPA: hypothetical protein PKB10_00805, partial [Tepidisphaeraceae bacterium]|nr:hypothetical protein [Tepidisphaeraceae bacterium]
FLFAMAPVLGMAEYVTDEPIRRWRYAASRALDMSPTVVLALGFALVYPRIPASFWRLPRLLPYVLGLCFILLVYHTMQQEGPLIIGLAAMACLIGALSLPTSPTTEWMARLGRLGFGVYLVHVAIIEGLQTLWLMTGRTITWQADLLVFALTVPLSFVFAWVLARTAIGRWLVPM